MSPYRIPGDPASGVAPLSSMPGEKLIMGTVTEVDVHTVREMMASRFADRHDEAEPDPEKMRVLLVGAPRTPIIEALKAAAKQDPEPLIASPESIKAELILEGIAPREIGTHDPRGLRNSSFSRRRLK